MELVQSNSGRQLAAPAPPKPNKATSRSVPAFLNKLFNMVSDPATDDLIHWSEDGDSFFITSQDRVAKELLPRFFKHENFGSFVRQLNMYGFHKVPHLQQGVLKKDASEKIDLLEFSNPNFSRAQPDLLCLIRRQKAKTGEGASGEAGALDIPTLLTDLSAIRKHQTAISADLKELQERNGALWQEALASREKHRKQEETINKILRFLAGVFGGQVLDAGASGGAGAGGSVSPVMSSTPGPTNGTSTGGKGKSNGVVVMPKGRPRLLLEDVQGRQAQRAAALRELDGDDDEEEIEEIPLLNEDDDLPTISSSLIASAPSASISALSRAPVSSSALTFNGSPSRSSTPSNRFTAIPTPSPLSTPALSNLDSLGSLDSSQLGNLSPDTINALLQAAGNNPDALNAFRNQQQAVGAPASNALAAPALPSFDFSQSLVPASSAPQPYTPYNPAALASSAPFDLSALTAPSSTSSNAFNLTPSLTSELAQNNAAISSLNSESLDIQNRTAALESQIANLMDSLPEVARAQVESAPPLENGTDDALAGFNWSSLTNDEGQFDMDKIFAQFTEGGLGSTPGQSSSALAPADPVDFTAFLSDPSSALPTSSATAFDPSLAGLTAGGDYSLPSTSASTSTATGSGFFPPAPAGAAAYEVTSPANSALDNVGSPASTVGSGGAEEIGSAAARKAAAAQKGGRKRKSDVLGSPADEGDGPASPAPSEGGTRRSSRRKKA
ncbi:hypothetical protein JCM10207_001299 [Rhodosporidiobolus poonsookiae]